jgi:para-nitrobenzyl esterase
MTISTTTAPTIDTAEGPVQGAIVDDVVAYRGIPYAAPPVGDLRWKRPQPVRTWTEPLPSNDKAPSCFQNRNMCIEVGGGDPDPMDEDCLYLDVWTPKPEAGAPKLPVMVWIHGGAYILGAGRLPVYHGAPIVKRGVILVTVNYRLGALGFFAHAALDEGVPAAERVYNFGILDQIAALEWVQRNIEKFGGDPGNVTIFGQSAGARSVLALFASPLVKDREPRLFHRGIAQSVYRMPEATRAKALTRGAALAKAILKIENGATATPEQLRGISARQLMNMDDELTPDELKGTSNSPVAIVGDIVLPTMGVVKSFVEGQPAALPLIIGNTSDDGSIVIDQLKGGPEQVVDLAVNLTEIKYPKRYYPDLATQDSDLIKPELGRRLARDAFFTVTTYNIAVAHSKRAPTWRYYFDYTAENLRPTVSKGTRHGDDILFTMNTLDFAPPFPPGQPTNPVEVTAKDREVASHASEYWPAFARTGTPSSAAGPEWPPHTEGQDKTLVLGESAKVETDFMQQRAEGAFFKNMVAFEKIGDAMDLASLA